MQVEHVTGVSLTSGWAAQQEGHLAVSHGLLGKVVEHDQCGTAGIAEEFADRGTGEGCVELHRGGVAGVGGHHGGVGHGTVLLQHLHGTGHGGTLLADGHIDAVHGLARVVEFLLVDDGVDGHRALAGLAVTDNELALAAADGNHGIDGLDAGLQRLRHGLAVDDARRLALDRHFIGLAFDGAFAVDGLTEGVHHTAHHAFAHFHAGDLLGALHGVALLDADAAAEEHHAHVVLLEVEHDAAQSAGELHELTALHTVEAVDAGDAVADLQHGTDLLELGFRAEPGEFFFEDRRYFGGFDLCHDGSL